MSEDFMRQRLDQEIETMSVNQLNELGNQAVSLGLIAGHGYHQGQYEILRSGQVLLMTPREAYGYLDNLIASVEQGE